jgi:outer membrane protein assembly factor BamE (lipoprotein component of BamABCDE complex)
MKIHQRLYQGLITCAILLSLSGCSYLFPVHANKVPQGNILSKAQITQVQVGMRKAQVREILGASALASPFDQDEWVYVYVEEESHKHKKKHWYQRNQPPKEIKYHKQKLVLRFRGGVLVSK